jgi:hypothetical protein
LAPSARTDSESLARKATRIRFSFNLGIWRTLAAAGAVVLYWVSTSGLAYELTTPVGMPHHVLLRKIYAVGAFALLGFLFEQSRFERLHGPLAAGIVVAIFSYAIEIGQIVIDHADETFGQHSSFCSYVRRGRRLAASRLWRSCSRSASYCGVIPSRTHPST